MNRFALFLSLYGSLFFLGAFLSVYWGKVAYTRFVTLRVGRSRDHAALSVWARIKIEAERYLGDRYFILALGLFLLAAGMLWIHSGRIYGNVVHGLSVILRQPEGIGIGVGLGLTLIASLLFVLLADLEKHPPHWFWLKMMGGLTVVWFFLCFALVDYLPLERHWNNIPF